MKDRRPGHENPRAGGDDTRSRVDVDAAVDLDRRGRVAGEIEQRRTSRTFSSLRGMNVWPPKPGLTDITSTKSTSPAMASSEPDRGRRVEDDARLGAERLDGVHRPMEMGQHLDVHGNHRRAGLHERLDVAIGLVDHQVDVERDPGDALERADDRRPDGDVRHEMAVHDVDMNEVGAAALRRGDGVAERGEVGRQDRWGNLTVTG